MSIRRPRAAITYARWPARTTVQRLTDGVHPIRIHNPAHGQRRVERGNTIHGVALWPIFLRPSIGLRRLWKLFPKRTRSGWSPEQTQQLWSVHVLMARLF